MRPSAIPVYFLVCCFIKTSAQTWTSLGTGTNNNVDAIIGFNGNIYAGGDFDTAGGVAANHVAVWNGTNWSAVGSGMNNKVEAFACQDTNELFAGGAFTLAGGMPAPFMAVLTSG